MDMSTCKTLARLPGGSSMPRRAPSGEPKHGGQRPVRGGIATNKHSAHRTPSAGSASRSSSSAALRGSAAGASKQSGPCMYAVTTEAAGKLFLKRGQVALQWSCHESWE
eukprot:1198011-Amphidinium_carterae.1